MLFAFRINADRQEPCQRESAFNRGLQFLFNKSSRDRSPERRLLRRPKFNSRFGPTDPDHLAELGSPSNTLILVSVIFPDNSIDSVLRKLRTFKYLYRVQTHLQAANMERAGRLDWSLSLVGQKHSLDFQPPRVIPWNWVNVADKRQIARRPQTITPREGEARMDPDFAGIGDNRAPGHSTPVVPARQGVGSKGTFLKM